MCLTLETSEEIISHSVFKFNKVFHIVLLFATI